MTREPVLPDGSYDAVVVDAAGVETPAVDATPPGDGRVLIELTIVAGEHRGEVVAIQAPGDGRDPTELMGLPATITVSSGAPHLEIEG